MESDESKLELLDSRVKLPVLFRIWQHLRLVNVCCERLRLIGKPLLVHQIQKVLAFDAVSGQNHLDLALGVPVF